MKVNKDRKSLQRELAKANLDFFLNLIRDKKHNKEFEKDYVREIKRLSEGFNLRLSREEKLLFCRECLSVFNAKNRQIRLKNRTKEVICLGCGYVRRFRY